MRQNSDLLISTLDLLLVVLILVLVNQDFLKALILDFLNVHQQVLKFLVHVSFFGLPSILFVSLLLLLLAEFLLTDALLCLKLTFSRLQIRLVMLDLTGDLLQLCIVLLQAVKFNLLLAKTLFSILILVL